jgi:hypothetical protein
MCWVIVDIQKESGIGRALLFERDMSGAVAVWCMLACAYAQKVWVHNTFMPANSVIHR